MNLDQKMVSTQSLVEDPDVERLEISIVLKPGKEPKDLSPFTMERVLLKYMASHFPTWAEYWMREGSHLG